MWYVTMILVVNAKRLYLSASGTLEPTLPSWRQTLWRALTSEQQDGSHPDSVRIRKGDKRRCKACYSCREAKETRTSWACPKCGPICKTCQHDGTHFKHAALPFKSRRSYSGLSFSVPSTTSTALLRCMLVMTLLLCIAVLLNH